MNFQEVFKQHLPKCLSSENTHQLLKALNQFTSERFTYGAREYSYYFTYSDDHLLQGDGLDNYPIVNLPVTRVQGGKVMVISNSCDIDPRNSRLTSGVVPVRLCYCPIISLAKYKKALEENKISSERVEAHIKDIKAQNVTQIFYLPKETVTQEENIIFFDNINSFPNDIVDRTQLKTRRLFSLSQFAHYLFLFKLSVHFTRFQDNVVRFNPT